MTHDEPIRPGYKRTEVGVIPQDWEVRPLGDVLKIKHGKSQKDIVDPSGKYPILATGGEIGRTNTPIFSGPSVLIGRKGTIDVPRYMATPFWTVDTLFYSEVSERSDARFLFYKFLMIDWYSYNEASGVPSLNAKTIEGIQVSLPAELDEQTAIAEALSDVDALLNALDRLIAKKRAIKQGAMQALLTGRVRLPGFTGEWKRCTLSEIGTFSKGSGIRKDDVMPDGLPCIRYGEIYTHHNDVVREYYSFIPREVAANSRRLQKGELLFAGSGETAEEIGKCVAFIGDEEVYAGGDIVIFSPRNQDSIYLGYLMNYEAITQQKASFAQGDAIVHISARNLGLLELSLPSLPEQRAIAEVLSDMDAEIDALEKRCAKLRAIKQGMMQELLTGRIRLVQPQKPAQEATV